MIKRTWAGRIVASTTLLTTATMSTTAISQAPAGASAPGTDAAQSAASLTTTLPTTAEGMILAPAETLGEFQPLVPNHPEGPNILILEGDPYAGPSITLFRYVNNYEGSRRLHTHSFTYRSILIEGEMKHWDENGSEETAEVLRPGSYWRQPGGELHADHCLTERCLALVTFEGRIDADFNSPFSNLAPPQQ